jgi:hypothetical protein
LGHRRVNYAEAAWAVAGFAATVIVSVAWVPLRSGQPNIEVGLLLIVVVTAVGVSGRRTAVLAAALGAAASFTFFDTEPYDHFTISRSSDVVTAASLVVVGLITGELALRVARQRRNDQSATGDLSRVREASALLAAGEELVIMIGAVAQNLTRQLQLLDCWFVAEPIAAGTPTVERDGALRLAPATAAPSQLVDQAAVAPVVLHAVGPRIPARATSASSAPASSAPANPTHVGPTPPVVSDRVELALPVWALGQVVGHFVLHVRPGTVLGRDHLQVAVTLADQVGASLAAQAPMPPSPLSPPPVANLRVIH